MRLTQDIAARVLTEELIPEQTKISKIIIEHPIFASSNALVIGSLQEMVQEKLRHIPVIEDGKVIGILDITKCLYDVITTMQTAFKQATVIAASLEGVERHWGNKFTAPFVKTIKDRSLGPALSTIITEDSRIATVVESDPVSLAVKRMQELKVDCVIIVTGKKIRGILTSKDLFMRVVAKNLPPKLTPVKKVMTQNPECATLDTKILEALHIMHNGNFVHLPVIDKYGIVIACVDVEQIVPVAISLAESNPDADMETMTMQKFWDLALKVESSDDNDDSHRLELNPEAHVPNTMMQGFRDVLRFGPNK